MSDGLSPRPACREASTAQLASALSSCAIVNVPADLLRTPAAHLVGELKPARSKPSVWLNSVHALAVLGVLDNRLGSSVLDPTFLKQLAAGR